MDNYKLFMHGLAELVVEKYNGSLKAEHGTGRNMAPFVKYEWGDEIYGIMKEIKALFDPDNLLNPGVLINEDLEVFAKNIKPFPVTHPLVDDCIECGFCERNCPSREFTLTPRQRIAAYREITRLVTNGKSKEVEKIAADYNFHGEESCATDGLCALDCPVGINTGKLIKELRYTKKSSFANGIASFLANHFGGAIVVIRFMLKVVGLVQKIIPVPVMKGMGSFLHKISGRTIPLWNEYMPQAAPVVKPQAQVSDSINNTLKVVYFPACINRIFGVSRDYDEKVALTRKTETVIRRAGYQIIYPEKLKSLCCGMAFDSKGFKDQGMVKLKELEAALLKASENGKYPVVCDMSPCLLRMKEGMDKRLKLYEPVEFTLTCLADKLTLKKLPISVSVHSTCSTTKMGLEDQLVKLAGLCAEKVVKPEKTGCCGWAGDKGFNLPELNTSALKYLKEELPAGLEGGYSNSRTCEIGLTLHSGISYKSVIYLVDKATV